MINFQFSNKFKIQISNSNFKLNLPVGKAGIKNYFSVRRPKGFTLLELIISMGILGMLIGFSSWAYLAVQKNSNLSNQTSQLVSSLRQAQTLSMTGQTQDQENRLNMGIHFESDRYIIFYGSIYNPSDTHNIATVLPQGITMAPNLGTFDLVFARGSGEVQNYDEAHHDLTISQTGGQTHLISINKMGTVDVN